MRRLAADYARTADVAPRMAFLRRSCKNVPGDSAVENQHESHDVAVS